MEGYRNTRTPLLAAVVCLMGYSTALLAAEGVSGVYFDVRAYGAKGDGTSLDTQAINAAIIAANTAGGGTVYFRAGTYVSYSIRLKSNVALYLDHGATIRAAGTPPGRGGRGRGRGAGQNVAPPQTRPAGEPAPGTIPGGAQASFLLPPLAAPAGPPAPPRAAVLAAAGAFTATPAATLPAPSATPATPVTTWDRPEPNPWDAYQDFGHSHHQNSLIWGEDLENISILGPGMIDGAGLVREAGPNTPAANKALALKRCRNVTLRDVTFYRGGHFCILATGVDNFTIDNCKFDTNRDAIDVVSCRNVRISNCAVNSPNDDGICLKSDYALGEARACENITVTNCQVSGWAVGSLINGTFDRSTTRAPDGDGPTGRIKFGTESNGGFKNITISNIVFDHCRGLAIECVDGGVIEDVTINNITMRRIFNPPIYIRLGDRRRGPPETTGVAQIRRINISNISASDCDSRYPVLISGLVDHYIEDVRLSNLRIVYEGGGTAEQARNVVPQRERDNYPEPSRLGILPASAFFIRHVKNLEMHNIDVTFKQPDARPIGVLDDVIGADFQHMRVQRFENVPYFRLDQVRDLSIQSVRSLADIRRDLVVSEIVSK